jgi:hypothetical protein
MHSHCRFDNRTASRQAEVRRCWRLPDRSKRTKTLNTQRAAKQFEAKLVTSSATGETLDPRGGRTELESVYQSWIASRHTDPLDGERLASPGARRGHLTDTDTSVRRPSQFQSRVRLRSAGPRWEE